MTFARLTWDGSIGPARAVTDCWVFDVDGCLVDSLTGSSLRPGARALLAHLAGRGTRVILWSAGGDEYARARAEQFEVDDCVDEFHAKAGGDRKGHYLTDRLGVEVGHVVFVDDRPEDLAEGLDVRAVSPYLSDDRHDRGLEDIARSAGLVWRVRPPRRRWRDRGGVHEGKSSTTRSRKQIGEPWPARWMECVSSRWRIGRSCRRPGRCWPTWARM